MPKALVILMIVFSVGLSAFPEFSEEKQVLNSIKICLFIPQLSFFGSQKKPSFRFQKGGVEETEESKA